MSASLARSLLSNWIGLFVAGVTGLVLSPILVTALGKELYGTWTLAASLMAQLVILDFGVRNSLVAFVSRARAHNDTQMLSTLLSTALTILTLLGFGTFILVVVALPYVASIFAITPALLPVFQLLLVIYAIDAAIDMTFGVFNGALAGSERYDVMNTVTSVRVIMNALLVVGSLQLGFGVIGVGVVAIGTRLAQRMAFAFFTFRTNRGVHVEYRRWSSQVAKEITNYGAWAFLVVLATRVIYQTDLIVIGIFLGPSSVALYAVAVILVDQLRMVTQTANTILTPRLSGLQANERFDEQKQLIEKWSFLTALLTVTLGVPLAVNGGAFIELWMGTGFEASGTILLVLIIPFFVTAPSLALSSYLFATSQHAISARVQMAEAALNLICSIAFVQLFGMNGVAWGTAIPAIVCTGILLPYATCQKMKIRFSDFVMRTSVRVLLPAIFYGGALVACSTFFGVRTWSGFLLSNAVPAFLMVICIYAAYLDPSDRSYLRRRMGIE